MRAGACSCAGQSTVTRKQIHTRIAHGRRIDVDRRNATITRRIRTAANKRARCFFHRVCACGPHATRRADSVAPGPAPSKPVLPDDNPARGGAAIGRRRSRAPASESFAATTRTNAYGTSPATATTWAGETVERGRSVPRGPDFGEEGRGEEVFAAAFVPDDFAYRPPSNVKSLRISLYLEKRNHEDPRRTRKTKHFRLRANRTIIVFNSIHRRRVNRFVAADCSKRYAFFRHNLF